MSSDSFVMKREGYLFSLYPLNRAKTLTTGLPRHPDKFMKRSVFAIRSAVRHSSMVLKSFATTREL